MGKKGPKRMVDIHLQLEVDADIYPDEAVHRFMALLAALTVKKDEAVFWSDSNARVI